MSKIILLVSLLVFTGNSILLAQNSTFYRTYNLGGMQGGLATLNMPDGGFVGAGQHEGNGGSGECDIYVYRVDACGNILWMKLIGTGAQEGAKHISLRSNGNLLLTGLYNGRGFLMELDQNGSLQWEKQLVYSSSAPSEWTIASAEGPGGVIYVTSTMAGGYVLNKFDANGNNLWSRAVPGAGVMPLNVLCISNDVFVTSTYEISGADFSITKFDGLGSMQWSKLYSGAGYGDYDHSSWGHKSVYDPTDNSIMIANQTTMLGAEDILLCKVNSATGSVIWSNIYSGTGSDQPRDITITDHGYAILGNTNSFPISSGTGITEPLSERDVLLINLDHSGNVLWSRTYGGSERDKGIGLRYNPGNGFLISAYSGSPVFGNTDASFDPIFIKTDTAGFVSCQMHSPTISATPASITTTSQVSSSPITVSTTNLNSNILNYLPNDYFICLSCVTIPTFVPSDTVICAGESVYFYNTTSYGLTCFQEWNVNGIIWNGGLDTITYTFENPGTYPILLYSNCGGQTDTFTVNITVHPNPNPGFQASGNCEDRNTVFNNLSSIPSGSITSYSWLFGDGSTSLLTSPTHMYNSAGMYNVSLSATSSEGCNADTIIPLEIHPNPNAVFQFTSACAGGEITFTDASSNQGSNINSWSWQTMTGAPWQNGNSTFTSTYPNAGSFMASLAIMNTNGCTDTSTALVEILPKPQADLLATDACLGGTTNYLNLTSGLQTTAPMVYSWNLGDNTISGGFQPSPHTYLNTGIYNVTLWVNDPSRSGCLDSASSTAVVHAIPEAFFTEVPPGCQPYEIQLNDASSVLNNSIHKWFWDFGNGFYSVQQNPSTIYTNAGTFTISLQVESTPGCKSAIPFTRQVIVHPKPFADFIFDPQQPTEFFPELHFRERSTGEIEYEWAFGDGEISDEANPIHRYDQPDIYSVSLIVTSDKACKDTAIKEIIVKPDYSLYVPNAFTPNADDKNELFRPEAYNISDFMIEIFNRWGDRIFTSGEIAAGWDGNYNGTKCPEGIYIYKISFRDPFNEQHFKTGKVSLVR